MADKENRPEAGAKPGSGDLLEKSASWASVSWQAESSWECTGLEPGPSPVASLCCNPVEVRGEGAGGERLPSQDKDTTPMALPGGGRRARRLLDSQTPPALGGICLSPDPKNPLNDDEIVEKLKEQGIDLARRTVAKYRKLLNIPTARQRKEF